MDGGAGRAMSYVSANGLEIGYDAHGAGPPMVLLHGASSSGREDFAAQVPLFAKAFRLYLPDARGHASTRWDASTGVSQDQLAEDLLGFVDALRLATFHLVGFSMGAITALRFAAREPERLRTLVVIGTGVEREPRLSVARRMLDPARIEADDPRWAAELARRHDTTQGAGAWRRLLEALVSDVASQELITPAQLRGVALPAMVVCGDRDPFVPVGQAWGLQRQLPDARLFVVPGCGHDAMVRRPALFNEAMASFYRATEAVARQRAAAGAAVGTAAPRAAGSVAASGTAAPPAAGSVAASGTAAPAPLATSAGLARPASDGSAETDGEWLARSAVADAGAASLEPKR